MKQINVVLSFFPLGLVEQILTKHRVPSKLSYLIMIFNYQPKKEKKFKEKMKLRRSISLKNGEGVFIVPAPSA